MLNKVLSTYSVRFVALVVNLAIAPLFIWSTDLQVYGFYVIFSTVAVMLQQDMGMTNSSIRLLGIAQGAGKSDLIRSVAKTTKSIFASLGLTAGIVYYCILSYFSNNFGIHDLLDKQIYQLSALYAIVVIVSFVVSAYRQILIGLGSLIASNLLQIAQNVFRISLMVYALVSGYGLLGVGVAEALVSILYLASVVIMVHKRYPLARCWGFESKILPELFTTSINLVVIQVSGSLIVQSGSLISGSIFGAQAAGQYNIAQKVYTFVKEVTNSLGFVVLPDAAQNIGHGDVRSNGIIYIAFTGIGNLLMNSVAVLAIGFMSTWISLWVGDSYHEAVLPAQILIVSLIVNGMHLIAIPLLTATGQTRPYAVLHSIWMISALTLSWLLAQRLESMAGVALGVIIPIIVLEPIYLFIAMRFLHLPYRDVFLYDILIPFSWFLIGIVLFLAAQIVNIFDIFGNELVGVFAFSALWLLLSFMLFLRLIHRFGLAKRHLRF